MQWPLSAGGILACNENFPHGIAIKVNFVHVENNGVSLEPARTGHQICLTYVVYFLL